MRAHVHAHAHICMRNSQNAPCLHESDNFGGFIFLKRTQKMAQCTCMHGFNGHVSRQCVGAWDAWGAWGAWGAGARLPNVPQSCAALPRTPQKGQNCLFQPF